MSRVNAQHYSLCVVKIQIGRGRSSVALRVTLQVTRGVTLRGTLLRSKNERRLYDLVDASL